MNTTSAVAATKRIARSTLGWALPQSTWKTYYEFRTMGLRLADLQRQLRRTNRTLETQLYPKSAPTLTDFELTISSQNGEDGILLWLFSVIGTTNRKFIEFGVGDGQECNTRNLAASWNWSGLWIEAEDDLAAAGARTAPPGVVVHHGFVDAETINETFIAAGYSGDLDLLSIDIDGNDYWVWNAIDAVRPRVVVIEYNASFGRQRSVAARYDLTFHQKPAHPLLPNLGWGSSLAAIAKLGAEKGFALVGCDSSGVNAFFVSRNCLQSPLREQTAIEAYKPSQRWLGRLSQEAQEAVTAHTNTVDV